MLGHAYATGVGIADRVLEVPNVEQPIVGRTKASMRALQPQIHVFACNSKLIRYQLLFQSLLSAGFYWETGQGVC